MKMKAINQGGVEILGAVLLRLSLTDKDGKVFETPQLVYVTNSTDKFYLSFEACIGLGLVPEDFPRTWKTEDEAAPVEVRECNCHERTLPPSLPSTLPFPATEKKCSKDKEMALGILQEQHLRTPITPIYGRPATAVEH